MADYGEAGIGFTSPETAETDMAPKHIHPETVKRADCTATALPHNAYASKRPPPRVGGMLPLTEGGGLYAFTEIKGETLPLVLMTATFPKSMTHPIKIAMPNEYRAAIYEATLGVNPLAAIVAMADFALDRLENRKPVELTIEPSFDDAGRWLDCEFSTKRADVLTIRMPQRMSRGTQRIGTPDARTQAPFPDGVVARIERAMGEGERFSWIVLGLAWWTIMGLRQRRKRLVISRAA